MLSLMLVPLTPLVLPPRWIVIVNVFVGVSATVVFVFPPFGTLLTVDVPEPPFFVTVTV
jgi:hypothetical protein